MGKYRAEVFYYEQQVREYRQLLHEPDKLVRKTISHLSTVPAFQQFMSKYSMLAVLFPTPEHYGTPQSLGGLQSRAAVMQTIQQRLPVTNTNGGNGDPAQYLQQQIQQAQSQLAEVKDKLNRIGIQGAGSSDMAIPDFKPNGQKTKSFLQRIELGADVQTRRSDYFFPVTTETGLTAGYRLTDKSVVGIGLSGKIGWGRDWKHIRLTGEGIGLRVYADWKAPDLFKTNSRFMAGLWFTAGAEMNYNRAIESFSVFKNYSSWTKSALAGLKKKYSISSPVKKGKKLEGNLQVLYDFLYRQHVPPTPALMWRVGYGL
ncbi:MAG: hypothetical protein M9904_07970 [Chitinophagaceae bacterium]|nr:hypothetical protein [Chitinophagaceae bacterium]